MARITWQNVAAPDFRDAILAQDSAGKTLSAAFSGLGDAFKTYDNRQREKLSAQALDRANQIDNIADWEAAMARGIQASLGVDPTRLSSGALTTILGRGKSILDQDRTELLNAQTAEALDWNMYTHGRSKDAHALTEWAGNEAQSLLSGTDENGRALSPDALRRRILQGDYTAEQKQALYAAAGNVAGENFTPSTSDVEALRSQQAVIDSQTALEAWEADTALAEGQLHNSKAYLDILMNPQAHSDDPVAWLLEKAIDGSDNPEELDLRHGQDTYLAAIKDLVNNTKTFNGRPISKQLAAQAIYDTIGSSGLISWFTDSGNVNLGEAQKKLNELMSDGNLQQDIQTSLMIRREREDLERISQERESLLNTWALKKSLGILTPAEEEAYRKEFSGDEGSLLWRIGKGNFDVPAGIRTGTEDLQAIQAKIAQGFAGALASNTPTPESTSTGAGAKLPTDQVGENVPVDALDMFNQPVGLWTGPTPVSEQAALYQQALQNAADTPFTVSDPNSITTDQTDAAYKFLTETAGMSPELLNVLSLQDLLQLAEKAYAEMKLGKNITDLIGSRARR